MEFGGLNYQNNNLMFQNQMNNQMFNPMIQNNMNNLMQNQMNNQMFYPMMNNNMNNLMYNHNIQNNLNINGIIQPMNNLLLNNNIRQNQINNQMYNGMAQTPLNNNMMPNAMNFGGVQNNFNNNINQNIHNNQINNNNNINEYNIPLENSIELKSGKNSFIKYYLYPEIDFTEEESKNSKVLLVIGQTGHGKTTFINALVNIYLGININDNFRYLLVQNENKNQLHSITKEITLYKIRPKKGLNFPPLIIIDTPGFGDTGGEKEDKLNLQKFKEFFESEKINNINCILYIIIGANARFGEIDKKIINDLLNLFSKNVKENFVVGVTNFFPENNDDIPNIINSLSNEDHFYYQNVLKDEYYSREHVLQSYWYFTSDNKIISNNKIERNEREKEKWKHTENQIKYFIEKKIRILENKNIEDSKNVMNNRFQLENEIKCFTEKIDVLISKKITYDSNLKKQQNFRESMTIFRDKIANNNIEKVNIQQTLNEINNAIPYMKKIVSNIEKTLNKNLICEECNLNCHKNCNCTFVGVSNWFCHMINFYGYCKICKHSKSVHKKGNFIYNQHEENEPLINSINSEIEEIKNYVKSLTDIKKEETNKMKNINELNNVYQETINNCCNILRKCDEEIERFENQNLFIENEVIESLGNIKKNLDFLRGNALNKENRDIKIFLDEYSENKNEKEKEIIHNLYQKFISNN